MFPLRSLVDPTDFPHGIRHAGKAYERANEGDGFKKKPDRHTDLPTEAEWAAG